MVTERGVVAVDRLLQKKKKSPRAVAVTIMDKHGS